MHIHETKAEADGISFRDTEGFTLEQINFLAQRGVVFLTTFTTEEGIPYGGHIISRDWAHAEEIAFGRGLGETILGRMVATGPLEEDPSGG